MSALRGARALGRVARVLIAVPFPRGPRGGPSSAASFMFSVLIPHQVFHLKSMSQDEKMGSYFTCLV